MSQKTYIYAAMEAIIQASQVLGTKDFLINGRIGSWDLQGRFDCKGQPTVDLRGYFGAKRVDCYSALDETWDTTAMLGAALIGVKAINIHNLAMCVPYTTQIITQHAAKLRLMTGGQATPGAVFLIYLSGRNPGSAGQHSDYLEDSWFMHTPGIKTIAPSTPYDVKGAMIAAIKSPDPIVIVSCGSLQNVWGEVPDGPYEIPFGKATVVQEGKDLTLVTNGGARIDVDKAIPLLKNEGISVEVIDLVSLNPLDTETLVKSARKTGRIMTVDWSKYTLAPGAEVVARVAEGAPGVRVKRIAHPDSPVAAAPEMCNWAYPSAQSIVAGAKELMKQRVTLAAT
jgi:pyruvate/2-oxoglutarate/acetoin dehydrogenase E1 component